MENCRRAIGKLDKNAGRISRSRFEPQQHQLFWLRIRIKETKEVYEGEVTELTPEAGPSWFRVLQNILQSWNESATFACVKPDFFDTVDGRNLAAPGMVKTL